jgi:peptidoglycan/xylan/chitin deacetylase (PgdA/CDA1 family)
VPDIATLPINPSPTGPRAWPWPPLLQASVGVHAAAAGAAWLVPGAAPFALTAVLLNHAAITAAGLWPRSKLLGPNLTRLPSAADTVALTLDDGPDPEVTPAVLDQLDEHGVKATFFCIATHALRHPALVRDIVHRGHDVQNHSFRHRHDFSLRGPAALAREIGQAQAALADLTGVMPHCFRAPAGLRNPFLDPVLHRLGLHLVSWTRRGFDTREGDAKVVLARLSHGLAAGDIVLLHDGHARRGASGRPVLLEVLPPWLEACRAAGLRCVTLREAVPPRHAAAAAEPAP